MALPNMVYFACDDRDLWGSNNEIEQINDGIWEIAWRADKSALGTIMHIDEIIETSEHAQMADKSALGAMNRPLQRVGFIRSCA